ncbi:hypothetical protein Thpro_022164 [Acidihalobacter prosperus]|uniref:Uncharacterized protein n=1 Tax=Acidihalobacter prosperus TaxID=160660 RepID=A0A1A6C030_9GAMM|nr:hypothetical protein Thpro_022164 [Acidihalobacter prosperus]
MRTWRQPNQCATLVIWPEGSPTRVETARVGSGRWRTSVSRAGEDACLDWLDTSELSAFARHRKLVAALVFRLPEPDA